MKRWNGWGSDFIEYPLNASAQKYLNKEIGAGRKGPSSKIDEVLRSIKSSCLPAHPLVTNDLDTRLRHARGQSLPDWIALRFNMVKRFPDGVSYPRSEKEILSLLSYAKNAGVQIIPYGGGSSVLGHINPSGDKRPVLTLNMNRFQKLTHLDKKSRIAVFGAGVTGPHLEAQLRVNEHTMGHFPQSFEYSTLGGWIATRSSGQQSLYYGRIEDLFAGGRMVTPKGILELPPFPASAAGPDLRHLVLGSEGRLGLITQAVVRISPLPEAERFQAVFFPSWESGVKAVREMVQSRLPLSMLRLSDSVETESTLTIGGHERLVRLLKRLLRARSIGDERCLLVFGMTGVEDGMRKIRGDALDVARSHRGVYIGRRIGSEWYKNRFRTPYLRNTLWELGYAVDTLETAFLWDDLARGAESVLENIRNGLKDENQRVLAFAHVSHVYRTGASIYITYIYQISQDGEVTLERWKKIKKAASEAIISRGGTISHHHGIGLDHRPYLESEKGKLGLCVLKCAMHEFDPNKIMNPHKLIK